MFIVFYPISDVEEQVINKPCDAFKGLCIKEEKDASDAMRILLSQFGREKLQIYSVEPSYLFQDLTDMVDSMNNQMIDLENLWAVKLNISEHKMFELTYTYSSDFILVGKKENKPLTFENGEMVVYGDYDSIMDDWTPEEEGYAILTNYNERQERGICHIYEITYNGYKKVGEIETDMPFDINPMVWKKNIYPVICDILKNWHTICID